MDKKSALAKAVEFAAALRLKHDFVKIILFGSYARGNQHPESDIDLAVVFRDFSDPFDLQLEMMRIRRKIDTRIEPHAFRFRDFNESNPIVHEILKCGVPVAP